MNDLRVNITGNQSGFQQVLASVRAEGKKLSEEWSGASIGKRFVQGASVYLGFEAIKSSFESFLQRASGLRELSEQLEMSADATQKWEKAVDRLGLSFTQLQTVLNAIQSKRIEALTDLKAADTFNRLGIARQDVLNLQGVDASEFARRVMLAGQGGGMNRKIVGELIGRRGLKYLATAGLQPDMSADFDKQALDAAHGAEIAQKRAGYFVGRIWGAIVSNWVDLFTGSDDPAPAWQRIAKRNLSVFGIGGPHSGAGLSPMGASAVGTTGGAVHDPLSSVRAEKYMELQDRIDAAREGEVESERALMTIGERRKSIQKEMLDIANKMKQVAQRPVPENLLSDIERAEFETKRKEELSRLGAKRNSLRLGLREHPLFGGHSGNSQISAGLFPTASAAAFFGSGAEGAAKEGTLQRCEHHLFRIANRPDPHNP